MYNKVDNNFSAFGGTVAKIFPGHIMYFAENTTGANCYFIKENFSPFDVLT